MFNWVQRNRSCDIHTSLEPFKDYVRLIVLKQLCLALSILTRHDYYSLLLLPSLICRAVLIDNEGHQKYSYEESQTIDMFNNSGDSRYFDV